MERFFCQIFANPIVPTTPASWRTLKDRTVSPILWSFKVLNLLLYSLLYLRIFIILSITVPPSAPVLYVTSATSSSILLHWKAGTSGGAVISGYILNFRKVQSNSEEMLLPRRISSYELKVRISSCIGCANCLPFLIQYWPLQNLSCGSTYHLFLIAQNKIGKSAPSPTLSVRTQGEAPGVPQGTTLIQPNSTSVLLRLHVWPDNGCPLLYFVIQYRTSTDKAWMLGNELSLILKYY